MHSSQHHNIKSNKNVELLKLTTSGSVDDGKSTLIGRLLYETNSVFEDQLEAIKKTSERQGKKQIDFSLITDGLAQEREQGITVDVGYRYFSTSKRRFMIADVPGHEEYTKNMITGAAGANVAMILIDAKKGITTQSKRHLAIAVLLEIPHILVAINKMDLVGYQKKVFDKLKKELTRFAARLNRKNIRFMPVSALCGDMVTQKNKNMPWYRGATILEYLENVQVGNDYNFVDFRFPIQMVIHPHSQFRGYAGQIMGGAILRGDDVVILPSNKKTKVRSIVTYHKEQPSAFNPQSVVLTLENDCDASRGDMIAKPQCLPSQSNSVEAIICWLSEETLEPHKLYYIQHTTKMTRGFVEKINHVVNPDTLRHHPASILNLNEIGRVKIKTHEPLFFDSYQKNKNTGSFLLIDLHSHDTIGAGIIVED